MNNLENVKVGDKLLVVQGGVHNNYFIEVVERITKTQVITERERHRFNKLTGRAVGYDHWNGVTARIATTEDIERVRRQDQRRFILARIRQTQFHVLSDDKLERIYNIIFQEK